MLGRVIGRLVRFVADLHRHCLAPLAEGAGFLLHVHADALDHPEVAGAQVFFPDRQVGKHVVGHAQGQQQAQANGDGVAPQGFRERAHNKNRSCAVKS